MINAGKEDRSAGIKNIHNNNKCRTINANKAKGSSRLYFLSLNGQIRFINEATRDSLW